jgi:radical SAM superfamily enzyme YgiQ (UPF0313 family)
MKKNVLLVSFDIRRPGEPAASYAVASLKASLLASPAVQAHIEAIESVSIGVPHAACSLDLIHEALHHAGVSGWGAYDTVAVSAYIWSDDWTKTFITMLRKEGYMGKIVLGGYQISYATLADLVPAYPEADLFLGMYAESSIIEAVRMARPAQPKYLANTDYPVDFNALPPLYASGLMPVRFGQEMVRMETKRGCPMKCAFCQYRDFSTNKVHKINQSRTLDDLTYLSQLNVGKINFTDAIFNTGSDYLEVTQHLKDLNVRSLLSFQIRPEYLHSATGNRFLDLASELNVVLEFGFQTSDPVENEAIQRHNHYEKIDRAAQLVQERDIPFEISLIYGLPHQTVDSFQKSIDYSLSLNPARVVAFPLMLYRGTPLYEQKAHYAFQEEVIGEYNVPVVTSSHTFTRDEWEIMHGMAERLNAGFSLSRVI